MAILRAANDSGWLAGPIMIGFLLDHYGFLPALVPLFGLSLVCVLALRLVIGTGRAHAQRPAS